MARKPKSYSPMHKRESTGRKFNGRKAIDKMYDETWNSYRRKFLAINSRCYACGEKADTIDHVRPHQGDKVLFEKTENHIPICTRHHNTITTLFDRRFKAGNSIEPKIRWLSEYRAKLGLTFRVKVMPSYP